MPATPPPPDPGQAARYERDLSALEGPGLDSVEMDRTLAALLVVASGSARRDREASGLTDEEWWAAHAPCLAKALDPGRVPLAARIGSAAAMASVGA